MVPYDKMGTNEIGEFVSRNIREYVRTANEKNLNEIYKSLLIIGERVLREDYRKKVDSYILDDINHQAAADTVLAIMKDPEQFKDNSNFLYYYRKVLKNDFIDLTPRRQFCLHRLQRRHRYRDVRARNDAQCRGRFDYPR